jgi:hypothetical protein
VCFLSLGLVMAAAILLSCLARHASRLALAVGGASNSANVPGTDHDATIGPWMAAEVCKKKDDGGSTAALHVTCRHSARPE